MAALERWRQAVKAPDLRSSDEGNENQSRPPYIVIMATQGYHTERPANCDLLVS